MASIFDALRGSLLGKSVSYHPRESGGKINTLDVISRIKGGLGCPSKVEDEQVDRAKDSLAEVKGQTEYQDAKAARLLTIVAFLTAAVGVLFGKFVDVYPLHEHIDAGGLPAVLVATTYASLGAYLILIACGAMITFQAIATRFVWPGETDAADQDKVRSPLFFQQIMRTKPDAWGTAFASSSDALKTLYYESLVVETYLVAAKVADKVRYLEPAQRLLLYAIRVLLFAFLLAILTFAVVESTKRVEQAVSKDAPVSATVSTLSSEIPARAPAPDQEPAASALPHPTEPKKAESSISR
jgi:hypothetical protein